jgi:hypothetical protein
MTIAVDDVEALACMGMEKVQLVGTLHCDAGICFCGCGARKSEGGDTHKHRYAAKIL